jgi:GH24 family phage-related lysozyme (muramidase)
MSAVDIAVPRLKVEEGFRARKYIDTRGYTTIAYGFNVDAGITPYAAAALLRAQAEEVDDALRAYRWYEGLDEARQSAVLDIAFNEGFEKFVNTWPHLIAALIAADWAEAKRQCHTSTTEDEPRYVALGEILLTGVSP